MGCESSQPMVVSNAAKNEVDEQLERLQEEERTHYKILLLGPGEAGKSTVLKQLKCIYKGGIPLAEQRMHGLAIRRNTIQSMQAILEATVVLGIPLEGEAAAAAGRVLMLDEGTDLSPEIVQDVVLLWHNGGVRAAYGERHRYWLLDAAAYYFDNVERFGSESFAPNEEDMLMARARTSGINVTQIADGLHKFSVVDVGGQRSERRKWIHCFDDVKAIIFVVALSGYNQVLFEDTGVNRMHEGLQLFEEVVRNPIFENTPIFVFLNKKDLFEQMMTEGIPLTRCFPDYRPGAGCDASDVHQAVAEIERRFLDVIHRHSPRKNIHVHVIASRVRLEMKSAFSDVKDRIKEYYSQGQHANGSLQRQVSNRL
ncbi:unnamed protein product [Ectocarpus sp. CCAP 1310/34]|nr:unnamed protein product [Ectocarpus sp. CCAP 1310/34]